MTATAGAVSKAGARGAGDAVAAGDPEIVEQVRLAQQGSAHAFALLYDHYVDQIFGYVLHRVGHRQTAEDLVADVFLRVLRRIASFRWQGVDFGAWLMSIARNRVHDHFKSARFRLTVPVGEVFDEPGPVHDGPEHHAVSADTARHVRHALGRMKGDHAEVLYLRFIQHLNVAETAVVMDRTSGAVKALQHRALRALAEHVDEELVA